MTDLLALALDATRAGGDAILGYYGQPLTVDAKADDSPLTQADLAAHRTITAALRAGSDVPVLSEESPEAEVAERKSWRRFWCVDPLDGTKEFIKGSPVAGSDRPPVTSGEFTVNIALIEAGVPVLGVVHVPVHGVTYFAAEGHAWKQAGAADPVRIATRQAAEGSLTIVASRDHAGAEVAAIIDNAEESGRAVASASMGSSLKFCLVAEGAADFYPRTVPTFEWDTAAAQAVVEAAGGGISTRDGRRLAYNKDDLRNPSVFAWGDAGLAWREWLEV
ncbi:3'(2'),5'-bisphosphate nucleotidase CysQ [Rubrivirga sp. IMCC43871]|uniref:3'(2'),5'-bisphosphate nucleotidase CysQ n=1 Tax=Rubrivirga sp. IMCC43871 TaxID=3391575 RepID=UPI00398FC2B9